MVLGDDYGSSLGPLISPAQLSIWRGVMPYPKKFDIVGLGLCCMDYLFVVPHIPALEEKMFCLDFRREGGGVVSTALVAASRLGSATSFIGTVGDDENGRLIIEEFKGYGVDIESFSYHDRLAGRPIHDEQGTHDRPHDLTCHFRKDSIDDLLGRLGVRPWLDKRPVLGVLLKVRRGQASYQVAAGNSRDLAMREAFAAASDLTGIDVVFPSGEYTGLRSVEGTMPLSGELDWSDSEGGWIATWELDVQQSANKLHEARWQVRGVSFDDAFRNALKGAAQILSGNGKPVGALTHAEK